MGISGEVVVAPALAAKLSGQRALFLIARDPGSQQIVAVRKEDGARFPFAFTISGTDSMMPGDVEGVLKCVRVGTRDVRITLDCVRP